MSFTKVTFKNKLNGFIALSRPKQWIKNLFVFAALIFSKSFFNCTLVYKTVLVFLSFCVASSLVYFINDLLDADKDRKHPKKRNRPIAKGVITKKEALFLIAVLFIALVLILLTYRNAVSLVLIAYLVNNILYSFKIKHVVILDIMSIALGFLLRVIAGAAAINVSVSPWILLCTLLLSLFLGFSKRRNELLLLGDEAEKHRKILEEYSVEFIDSMLSIVTACTVIAYSLYTFFAYSNKFMMLTIPFVLYGIFRYQYLIHKKGEGGSPEEIVISDKPLLLSIVLWVICSACIVYLI